MAGNLLRRFSIPIFFFTRKGINTNSHVYKYLRLICQFHNAIMPGVRLELTLANYKLAVLADYTNPTQSKRVKIKKFFLPLCNFSLSTSLFNTIFTPPQQKGFHWDICIASTLKGLWGE